jgi:transcriptional regulator with XRE-family HTH domain
MRLSLFFSPLRDHLLGQAGKGSSAMTGKNTRFGGEQPIRAVVRRRHWNLRLIAYETGVAYSHLINAANGITAPSPELRQKLSEFLDLPVEKLFTPRGPRRAIQSGPGPRRQDQPQVREARGMNARVRDALRQAGAQAGRKARADAGLPEQVEDHRTLVRMAELLIKAGGRRDAA